MIPLRDMRSIRHRNGSIMVRQKLGLQYAYIEQRPQVTDTAKKNQWNSSERYISC